MTITAKLAGASCATRLDALGQTDARQLQSAQLAPVESKRMVITSAVIALIVVVTIGIVGGVGTYTSLRDKIAELERRNAQQSATIAELRLRASR